MITGAYVYDHDGFPRALELLASGRVPLDELVEAEDFPLNRLLDAAIGLHEGRLPAKAMVVPRVDDGAEERERPSERNLRRGPAAHVSCVARAGARAAL